MTTQNKSRKFQCKPEKNLFNVLVVRGQTKSQKLYLGVRENSLNAWDRQVIKPVLCFWGFVNKVEKISAEIKYRRGLPPNITNSEGNSGKITPQQQDTCKMSRAWYQKSCMWPGKPQEVKQSTLLEDVKMSALTETEGEQSSLRIHEIAWHQLSHSTRKLPSLACFCILFTLVIRSKMVRMLFKALQG